MVIDDKILDEILHKFVFKYREWTALIGRPRPVASHAEHLGSYHGDTHPSLSLLKRDLRVRTWTLCEMTEETD